MLTATGQDGRPAGSTGPIGRGAEYFPFAISRRPLSGEILLISPVRELGGTSTIHLAVAGGGHTPRPGRLAPQGMSPRERVGASGGRCGPARPPPWRAPRRPPCRRTRGCD